MSRIDEELKAAVQAVYRKYGNNLAAFWRDAFAEEVQRHGDKAEPYIVDGNCIHGIPICRTCQLTTIEAHLREKSQELEPFCEHKEECKSNERYPSPPCDCGLVAALATAPTETSERCGAQRCVKCYHGRGVRESGLCAAITDSGYYFCSCECVFPASTEQARERRRDLGVVYRCPGCNHSGPVDQQGKCQQFINDPSAVSPPFVKRCEHRCESVASTEVAGEQGGNDRKVESS